MKKKNKGEFYNEFTEKELEALPVNYRLLTHLQFQSNIITSETDIQNKGIEVEVYNGKILSSERPFSPISKIIDFE